MICIGCADKMIRVFDSRGKLLRTIKGHTDVVRALCRVPSGHGSGAAFASASNDGTIRLWTLDGHEIAQLLGHENFIYSLGSLPSGEIISSGEDRTARIWRGTECVQTITHPAISVWGIAACPKTGDIVTGASDRVVRVFSRNSDRQASTETIRAFDDSVNSTTTSWRGQQAGAAWTGFSATEVWDQRGSSSDDQRAEWERHCSSVVDRSAKVGEHRYGGRWSG